MTTITSFEIDFPLDILNMERRIRFSEEEFREDLFKRNMYWNLFEGFKNPFLNQRKDYYESLANVVLSHLMKKYPEIKPLNISVFGSAIFSKSPEDYDCLAITEGSDFLTEETSFLENNCTKNVGISIKGLDHFIKGFQGIPSKNPRKKLEQIINRTAVALFRRHLPIWGYDFINNEDEFLKNIHAQASDLLDNAYFLYYLDNERISLNNSQRAGKILSRVYQVSSYLNYLEKCLETKDLRKLSYELMTRGISFEESKKHFENVANIYEEKIKRRSD